MWRFHWDRYGGRRAVRIFLDSAAGVEKWRAVAWGTILLILWLLGPPVQARAVSASQLLPGWVVPVFLLASVLFLFGRGVLKENYERFQEEAQKREQVKAEKARLEKKLASERKRKAVKDLLGDALEEGLSLKQGKTYNLENENPDKEDDELLDEYHAKREGEEHAWVDRTYALIHDAFGKDEAQRFINNEGFTEEEMFGRKMPRFFYLTSDQRKYLIPPRLRRLHELTPRLHDLDVNPDFDPQDWTK